MRDMEALKRILDRIDGKGYKAYQDLRGEFTFAHFTLSVDHVQGDPFASPSKMSVRVETPQSGLPAELYGSRCRRRASEDFLARSFLKAIRRFCSQRRGTGRSGLFSIDAGHQEVLERSSIFLSSQFTEARITVGLPASGRRILGRQAQEMLLRELPQVVLQALFWQHLPSDRFLEHVETVEDQVAMREQLKGMGLVAFIGNGSILPRASGVDDRPLLQNPVRFKAPSELEVEITRPNAGPITGMGVPSGVTLIVGGGYHGKSTLLRALERGVYDHIPGDGRETTVTDPSAAKIRAEDGRFIEGVDITPFIKDLPFHKDTRSFSTENASGSTSQAANIIESLEVGTNVLLIDEDTSATNFIIRDARMQALVEKEKEPITPFLDRVKQINESLGTSTIMVMGGSGDYFEVADLVIMMDGYRPLCVTSSAHKIVKSLPTQRRHEVTDTFSARLQRKPLPEGFDPRRGRRDVRIDTKGIDTILFGSHQLDLSALEQLIDPSQTRAIAQAILYFSRVSAPRKLTLRTGLQELETQLDQRGLDVLGNRKQWDLARPRIHEIAAAINRLRTLKVER